MRNTPLSDLSGAGKGPATHVIILDGTLSSLDPDFQTNAGRAFSLLNRQGAALSVYYEPGLQWTSWRSALDVLTGRGINGQIRRAYGCLAKRYRPGDRIFLFGYSRGAYAVRSLAGVIDKIGLLRADAVSKQKVRAAYGHYESATDSPESRAFSQTYCHSGVKIEMIGVWDTVKSLGINAPVLWRFSEHLHAFHNHELSPGVQHGYHALAHDETRVAYAPVLWTSHDEFEGRVVQMWFPGTHGDVGGQLGGFEAARPLANIPLVWILSKAEALGLPLPAHWRDALPQSATAPMLGTFRGHGRILMIRKKRLVGRDPSEQLHPTIAARAKALGQQTGSAKGLFAKRFSQM